MVCSGQEGEKKKYAKKLARGMESIASTSSSIVESILMPEGGVTVGHRGKSGA
jgi:hypothetical protein